MLRILCLSLMCICLPLHAKSPVRKLNVVTSFSILEDITKQIGGDRVEVKSLIGRNGDTHSFEPKPSDARMLKKADLVIVNGLGFEGWMPRLVQSSGYPGDVVEASTAVVPLKNVAGEEEHGTLDPHAWQSLKNGEIYARNIATALAAKDPDYKDYYSDRLKGYLAHIAELDQWAKKQLTRIPAAKRRALVPHNSFTYFTRDYGIVFVAPQGLSTESDSSARDIATIIDDVRGQSVSAIFSENIQPSPIIEQIARETALPVGGRLFTDALSTGKGPATTYLEMFRHNIDTLVETLK